MVQGAAKAADGEGCGPVHRPHGGGVQVECQFCRTRAFKISQGFLKRKLYKLLILLVDKIPGILKTAGRSERPPDASRACIQQLPLSVPSSGRFWKTLRCHLECREPRTQAYGCKGWKFGVHRCRMLRLMLSGRMCGRQRLLSQALVLGWPCLAGNHVGTGSATG